MTIRELNDILKYKKWLFEISISGRPLFGKRSLTEVENLSGTLEEYLQRVAKNNNTDILGITLFAPNGTSTIRKNFFLLPIAPVVTPTKTVEASTNIVAPSTPVVEPKPINKMDNIKAEIENVRLAAELSFLKQRNSELEERQKKAEAKLDELYTENLKLNRQVNEENGRLNLEHQKRLVELEREHDKKVNELDKDKKGGLSGIVDEVSKMPPEAWQFLAGLLPNHPMAKMLGPGTTEQTPKTDGALGSAKHQNPDAQSCIDLISKLLVVHDAGAVGKITLLVEYFTKNNDALDTAYNTAFPS